MQIIVRLKTGQRSRAAQDTAGLRARHGLQVKRTYSHVFEGFSASVPRSEVETLRRDPSVAEVYTDGPVHVTGQRIPAGVERIGADTYNRVRTKKVTTRGDIAIIDTGVSPHRDLNLYRSVDCTTDVGCSTALPAPDAYGHGTLVAGVAAARDNHRGVVGVAPGARIWNVRVFDDSGYGSISGIVSAFDWIAARSDRIEVANASLGGSGDGGMTAAIQGATRRGVVVVVAAGNDSGDAALTYPASVREAITVSAFIDTDGKAGGHGHSCETDPGVFQRDDTFLAWSNYGSVVDLAAPGGCVLSTAPDGGYASESGTSFSAPHAAGAALLWINKKHLSADARRAATVEAALRERWSVPQGSRKGFTQGRSSEPVLLIRGHRH